MAGTHDGMFPRSPTAAPRAAGGAINGHRALMALLLVLIGVAAIAGITVSLMSGQTNAAIVIGIFAAAFFTRIGC